MGTNEEPLNRHAQRQEVLVGTSQQRPPQREGIRSR